LVLCIFILGFLFFFFSLGKSVCCRSGNCMALARARPSLSLPLSFEIHFARGFASTIECEENCRRKTEAIYMWWDCGDHGSARMLWKWNTLKDSPGFVPQRIFLAGPVFIRLWLHSRRVFLESSSISVFCLCVGRAVEEGNKKKKKKKKGSLENWEDEEMR